LRGRFAAGRGKGRDGEREGRGVGRREGREREGMEEERGTLR